MEFRKLSEVTLRKIKPQVMSHPSHSIGMTHDQKLLVPRSNTLLLSPLAERWRGRVHARLACLDLWLENAPAFQSQIDPQAHA